MGMNFNNMPITQREVSPYFGLYNNIPLQQPEILDVYNAPLQDLVTTRRTQPSPTINDILGGILGQPAEAAEPSHGYFDWETGTYVPAPPSQDMQMPNYSNEPIVQNTQVEQEPTYYEAPQYTIPVQEAQSSYVAPEPLDTLGGTTEQPSTQPTIPSPEESQVQPTDTQTPMTLPQNNEAVQQYVNQVAEDSLNRRSLLEFTPIDIRNLTPEQKERLPLDVLGNLAKGVGQVTTGMLALPAILNSANLGTQALMNEAASNITGVPSTIAPLGHLASEDDKIMAEELYNALGTKEGWKNIGNMLDQTGVQPITTYRALKGEVTPEDWGVSAANKTLTDPFGTILDASVVGGVTVGSASKIVNGLSRLAQSFNRIPKIATFAKKVGIAEAISQNANIMEAAEDLYNLAKAEVTTQTIKTEEIIKSAEAFNKNLLAQAVKAVEEGIETTGKIKDIVDNVLRPLAQNYDNLVSLFSPFTRENPFAIVLKQLGVRKNLGNYSEMEKAVTPYLENPEYFKDGVITERAIADLSASKDPIAKLILEANEKYQKGLLIPVPHANAGVKRLLGEGKDIDRIYAGKFSQRVLGSATYEEIADALSKSEEWLANTEEFFTESNIINQINKGALAGSLGAADTVYISEQALKEAKTVKDITNATTKTPTEAKSIPLDAKKLEAVDDYIDTLKHFGNPFKSPFMRAWYRLCKELMLASGRYLVGNMTTGALNAAINSNIFILRDLLSAMATKGELGKLAGTARRTVRTQEISSGKLEDVINFFNKPLSNAFNVIDAKAQNLFAEMAINNKLASKGVPLSERAKSLENMHKTELAEVIRDAHDVAALRNGWSMIPKSLRGVVATIYPFYRWTDDATRSTVRMWAKHPAMSNAILHYALGEIPFNLEMQHRLHIRADMDKPNVHIKFNPKTGQYRDTSMDYAAQTTSLRVLGDLANAITNGDVSKVFGTTANLNPVMFAALGAFKGVDKYGKPIQRETSMTGRPVGIDYSKNVRYYTDSETGDLKKLVPQADEILNTAFTETIALPRFINKTVMEAAVLGSSLLGKDTTYYQPRQNRPIGSFDPRSRNVNLNNPVTPDVALSDILGMYTSAPYDYPYRRDEEQPFGRDRKRIMRNINRGINRNEALREMLEGGRY